jgi:hypothetical protein
MREALAVLTELERDRLISEEMIDQRFQMKRRKQSS